MRVHIKHGKTSIVVPIPQAKAAEWTVADLLAEATRRLAGAKTSESKDKEGSKPALTSLRIAGSQSELLMDDLVSEVLTNDEQLVGLGPEAENGTQEEQQEVSCVSKSTPKCTAQPIRRQTYNTSYGSDGAYGQGYGYGASYGSACVDDAPAQEEESSESFILSTRELQGEETEEKEVVVTLVDQQLKNAINGLITDELLYEDHPTIEADVLLSHLSLFKNKRNQCHQETLKPLVAFLEKHQEVNLPHPFLTPILLVLRSFVEQEASLRISHMMERKEVTFPTLWHMFPPGAKVWGQVIDDEIVGGQVKSVKYVGSVFRGFTVSIMVIKGTGNGYATREHTFYIPRFEGTSKVDDLPVHLMSEEVEMKLRERGLRFSQLAIGAFHKNYRGHLFVRSGNSISKVKGDGRVMIDGQAFNRYRTFLFLTPIE